MRGFLEWIAGPDMDRRIDRWIDRITNALCWFCGIGIVVFMVVQFMLAIAGR